MKSRFIWGALLSVIVIFAAFLITPKMIASATESVNLEELTNRNPYQVVQNYQPGKNVNYEYLLESSLVSSTDDDIVKLIPKSFFFDTAGAESKSYFYFGKRYGFYMITYKEQILPTLNDNNIIRTNNFHSDLILFTVEHSFDEENPVFENNNISTTLRIYAQYRYVGLSPEAKIFGYNLIQGTSNENPYFFNNRVYIDYPVVEETVIAEPSIFLGKISYSPSKTFFLQDISTIATLNNLQAPNPTDSQYYTPQDDQGVYFNFNAVEYNAFCKSDNDMNITDILSTIFNITMSCIAPDISGLMQYTNDSIQLVSDINGLLNPYKINVENKTLEAICYFQNHYDQIKNYGGLIKCLSSLVDTTQESRLLFGQDQFVTYTFGVNSNLRSIEDFPPTQFSEVIGLKIYDYINDRTVCFLKNESLYNFHDDINHYDDLEMSDNDVYLIKNNQHGFVFSPIFNSVYHFTLKDLNNASIKINGVEYGMECSVQLEKTNSYCVQIAHSSEFQKGILNIEFALDEQITVPAKEDAYIAFKSDGGVQTISNANTSASALDMELYKYDPITEEREKLYWICENGKIEGALPKGTYLIHLTNLTTTEQLFFAQSSDCDTPFINGMTVEVNNAMQFFKVTGEEEAYFNFFCDLDPNIASLAVYDSEGVYFTKTVKGASICSKTFNIGESIYFGIAIDPYFSTEKKITTISGFTSNEIIEWDINGKLYGEEYFNEYISLQINDTYEVYLCINGERNYNIPITITCEQAIDVRIDNNHFKLSEDTLNNVVHIATIFFDESNNDNQYVIYVASEKEHRISLGYNLVPKPTIQYERLDNRVVEFEFLVIEANKTYLCAVNSDKGSMELDETLVVNYTSVEIVITRIRFADGDLRKYDNTCADVEPISVNIRFISGNGTISDPYTIANSYNFNNIRYSEAENTSHKAIYYVISLPVITLNLNVGSTWTPIPEFYGNLSGVDFGNGKNFLGLINIDLGNTTKAENFGLFKRNYGVIHDFQLSVVNVDGDEILNADWINFGCVAAENYGVIENITVGNLTIYGDRNNARYGGIAGLNEGTINNCEIDSSVFYTCGDTGGIAGKNTGTITNCTIWNTQFHIYHRGTDTSFGGIVGYSFGGSVSDVTVDSITITYENSIVNSPKPNIGFIVGNMSATKGAGFSVISCTKDINNLSDKSNCFNGPNGVYGIMQNGSTLS